VEVRDAALDIFEKSIRSIQARFTLTPTAASAAMLP
jgi:hypothetical protein